MRQPKPRRVPLDLHRASDPDTLFRLSGSLKRDPAVDAWFADGSLELRAIARQWFEQMRTCGDDVRELMHDGCPVACVGDVPFGYVNTFKSHINVGFFRGSMLEDPAHLLEGSGKRMRHVKLKPDSEFDTSALTSLIRSSYADIKTRLR